MGVPQQMMNMPNNMPMMNMGQMGMPMMGQIGMPMMPNPMMMMAGMMSGMTGGCCGCSSGNAAASSSKSKGSSSPQKNQSDDEADAEMDPDVQKLGDHFNIEDRWIKRLDELMRKRRDTKEQDLAKLYEVLEQARSPTGLLVAKLGEMECGQFVGKIKPDKQIERIATRYRLDARVISRLTELRVRRKRTKDEDFNRLELHLSLAKRPSAVATLLIGKLLEGELRDIPDLTTAKALATRFKLDKDAKSKLREIGEKRAEDMDEVMAHLERMLLMSHAPSATLCKIAKTLMDGGRKRKTEDTYTNDAGFAASDSESAAEEGGNHNDCSSDSSSIRRREEARRKRSRSRGKKGKSSAATSATTAAPAPANQKAKKQPEPPKPSPVQLGSGSSGWVTVAHEPSKVVTGGGSGGWTTIER